MYEFRKAAALKLADQVTQTEMDLINQHTLKALEPEDVFIFKVMAGDNQSDDRNHEPFSAKGIQDMAELYKGKPMIWDHGRGNKGTEQVARIYDAEAVQTGKLLDNGAPELQLVLKAYMLRTDGNEDLIREIEGGIKKEVSTSCRPETLICSVCGQDQMKSYCRHWAGNTYEGKTCLMTIDGVKDVYEVSFVGVPAQPRAGTVKAYNPLVPEAKEEDFKAPETESDYALELKERELFVMHEKFKED